VEEDTLKAVLELRQAFMLGEKLGAAFQILYNVDYGA
jgi:hypothetical protein